MAAEPSGAAELPLYLRDDFVGRSLTVRNGAADLRERDFIDTVQSVRVRSGYWEVCEDVGLRGRCARWVPASMRAWNARATAFRRCAKCADAGQVVRQVAITVSRRACYCFW